MLRRLFFSFFCAKKCEIVAQKEHGKNGFSAKGRQECKKGKSDN